jgi:hypothetical protein
MMLGFALRHSVDVIAPYLPIVHGLALASVLANADAHGKPPLTPCESGDRQV